MVQTSSAKLVSFAVIGLFLLPIFFLIPLVGGTSVFNLSFDETLWGLKNTLLQTFGSTVLLLFGSALGGLGLLSLSASGFGKVFRGLFVIPYFFPPIFAVLAGFQIISGFPRGWLGISLLHAWMNVGMGCLLCERFLRNHFADDADVFKAFNLSRLNYFAKVVLPQAGPLIKNLMAGFFPLFFASFTIPLVLGGSSGTTLEILIYEKMRMQSDWGAPLVLSLLQVLLQLVVLSILGKPFSRISEKNSQEMNWLAWQPGFYFIAFLHMAFVGAFACSFLIHPQGLMALINQSELHFLSLVLNSVFFAGLMGIFLFSSLCVFIYWQPTLAIRFFDIYSPPGTALFAFSFLIMSLYFEGLRPFILYFCFFLLFFPLLVRTFILPPFRSLAEPLEIASVFGAGRSLTFRRLIFPHVRRSLVLAASVGSLWVVGDFSAARILSSSDWFLGLLAGTLLGGYHLDLAGWVCLMILVLGGINFLFLNSLSYLVERLLWRRE